MTTKEFMTSRGFEPTLSGWAYKQQPSMYFSDVEARLLHQLFIEGQLEALKRISDKDIHLSWQSTIEAELADLTKDLAAIKEGKI